MKTRIITTGLAVAALSFTGCKSESEKQAEKTVDRYEIYVDSVTAVTSTDARQNWQSFEAGYQQRTEEAEAAMANLSDKTKAEERLAASKAKYAEYKMKVEEEAKADMAANANNYKMKLRTSLFGDGKVGEDMSFAWVNKDNIHEVFQQFVHTAENNKDAYTREDWDEIKVMWEALNDRKNTVEKEGLSSSDNMKIAGLKIKFAPMLKVNRIGQKIKEKGQ